MMEGGQPSGGAPTAAPKRGAMWIVIAIVIAVAVTAAVMDLAIFPALQTSQSPTARFWVTTLDFAYDKIGVNPELDAKAGQVVLITLANNGTNAHEFLLFKGDRTAILNSAKAALAQAIAMHPELYWTNLTPAQHEDAVNTTLADYSSIHDSWSNLTRVTDTLTGSLIDHNVDVGATSLFWFAVNTPGTYFFACHMVDTTDPNPSNWVIHQAHTPAGMWGTLVLS
jgi:uncharacterized cupredoxin-like copper-binding protein